ncbi:MAG TPA: hypothetical protein VG476_07870 [Acidimicrobiales bacterium]|nr:hypothetical protein [Acidimicrobiales bacterium]
MRRLPVRGEDGQVAGIEALLFGLLVLVFGTLVVANAWGVIDAKLAAAGAAREAARAFVQTPAGSDPASTSRAAAVRAMQSQGRDPARMTVLVSGDLTRCSRVVAEVRYRVPLIVVPMLGGLGSGFTASAHHSELVDPYRTGLPRTANCATTG